jgi:hypothetical protein
VVDAVVALPAVGPLFQSPPPAALTEAALGQLLGPLASRPGPVPKYIYPSAGTLYPVQAYVVLRRPVGALPAGSYYHDADAHALVALSGDAPLAPDGTEPDVLLLLVAQRAAIEPIYGAQSSKFCLLEAGYMTEALRTAGSGLRLRDAGNPDGHAALATALRLDSEHLPLVCWEVGEDG